MSKTTHDLLRHKKLLTVDEAIKRFYDFLKKHAPQHQPLNNRPDKPLINYRGAYDIPGMFDRFTEEEEVEVKDEKDEDDGKYDEPEPSKYAELIDLIKQSNDNKIQIETPEHRRMYNLYRIYKADEDDETELPYLKHRTETLLRWLKYMSPKEQRGEDLTLEEAKAFLQKDEERNRKNEENLRQLREDMKKQEEKNKRYRIEEAKAKRGEKPSDEFIHTVLGTIYREALKAKEKK
jgi:lysyl-tRNA synthetase class I